MYGEVTMITDSIDNQVIIPLNSVIRKGEEQFVYKYEEEKAVKIPVEKGIIEGEKVQVFGDISEEDMIIVKGQNYISEDSLLKVVD
jgi:multidrug efflux pump subunit AcrA (membrane-fusion protein)